VEKLLELEGLKVNRETLRQWVLAAGLWEKKRKSGRHRQWLSTAMACDSARWWNIMVDSGFTTGHGTIGGFGFEIDFSTHVVIILRAGAQTRWGGGVWLSSFETSGDNTMIEYTVMKPGDDCPLIDGLLEVNPIVAIRVPKPVGNVVSWNRHIESIECSWSDSTFVGNPTGGGR
jgi:hypothetical protein